MLCKCQKSNAENVLNIEAPSQTLKPRLRARIFLRSSSDSSKLQLSKFYCRRAGLLVLGITPTPRCKVDFIMIWAGLRPYLAAISHITSSFKMLT